MKYGTWAVSCPKSDADVERLRQSGYSPITAAVLCSRGYDTPERARAFLSCDAPLSDPFEMLDMERARARVQRALDRKEHICVFGDYDVDGITATCLMTEFLRDRGGRVTSYIPARLEEGYGLNELALRTLAAQGVRLIVTVDCGITANAEAELCRELGMDLVITDHHECKSTLPVAEAVVDPHRPDQTPSALHDLAGVGVAFKLAAAISGDQQALLERFSDLLCLGTVADVMPLTGENRAMVAHGLAALEKPKRVGIAALMAECCTGHQSVTAGTIGYTLAPRINAAGRMGEVHTATELFLTRDASRAAELAQQLCRLNRRRQEVETEIYRDAVSMLPHGKAPSAIVLSDEAWHQGVVGIVASRLAEEYSCPTFLICLDGDKGKASSRSYGGFNLFGALHALSPLLESYGGHELAAGFTIRRDQIPAFRDAVCMRTEEFFHCGAGSTALTVDCEIAPGLLTLRNVEALDELEPCGAGCPRPVLCMRGLTIQELSEVGGGKHLRLRLGRGRDSFQAIFFSSTAQRAAVGVGDVVEIAFTPQINEFRGIRSVQLNLVDIRPDEPFRDKLRDQAALYDRHAAGESLPPEEAAALLPERQEFVDLWRYLRAHCAEGSLTEELGCLSRKIARATGRACEPARLRICLDVLAEQSLIRLELHPKSIHITLCAEGRKVDLTQSHILIHLKQQKAGT